MGLRPTLGLEDPPSHPSDRTKCAGEMYTQVDVHQWARFAAPATAASAMVLPWLSLPSPSPLLGALMPVPSGLASFLTVILGVPRGNFLFEGVVLLFRGGADSYGPGSLPGPQDP